MPVEAEEASGHVHTGRGGERFECDGHHRGEADAQAAALWEDLTLGYTEPAGHPLLRAEIASLYEGLEPGDVYTFAGAEEAIFVLMHALLRPGDHVLALWPAYQGLYEIARSIG